jgi:hypothetical protein
MSLPRSYRGHAKQNARWIRLGFGLTLLGCAAASAATLGERAKESGCVNKPVFVAGDMYRCLTESGASSYFNVQGAGGTQAPRSTKAPTPTGFPRVDPDTQKGRDDVRRKVLSEELTAEEKLLSETRGLYADGAPVPLPEERADAEKYRLRIARLRQTVNVHEKNIEALKKELSAIR